MKNVMISIGLIIMTIITTLILYTVYGQNTRQNEIEDSLSIAIEQSLENMMTQKDYAVGDEEEFTADFMENMVLTIESDSNLTVNFLELDIEKGLVDVEVVEKFKQPNGSTGTVSCRKTMILEDYIEKDVPIYHLITFEALNKKGEYEVYKKYSLCEDSPVIVPPDPPAPNDTTIFYHWSLTKPTTANPQPPATSWGPEGSQRVGNSNQTFYAVYGPK